MPSSVPRHLQRIWDGRPIDGRRVLVRCYHGLGDTIQFARFLPLLARRAASVVVWAQPALIPLLSTLAAPLELLPLHDGVPEARYDVDVEIMELAWLLRTTLATLPRDVPYLHVEPDGALAFLDRAQVEALNVAVVWRAGAWNPSRSIATEDASSLADVPGVACFATEPRSAAAHVADWRGGWQPCDSVDALARFVAGVDLLVCVDTMCAHLAGALGVPVWTLLARDADWRWIEATTARGIRPCGCSARRRPARGRCRSRACGRNCGTPPRRACGCGRSSRGGPEWTRQPATISSS